MARTGRSAGRLPQAEWTVFEAETWPKTVETTMSEDEADGEDKRNFSETWKAVDDGRLRIADRLIKDI